MSKPLLRNLASALQHLGVIPLYGSLPPFPFDKLAQTLSSTLELDATSVVVCRSDIHADPLKGMGQSPLIRPFVLSPLPDEFFFSLAKNEVANLVNVLLSKGGSHKAFSDHLLQDSLVEVAFLTACHIFNQVNPFGNLTAGFADPSPLPEDGALCHDLSIQIGWVTITGRLICPFNSLSALRSYSQMEQRPLAIGPDNAHLPIPLSYQVGQTTLEAQEWKGAKAGDCLLLDRCTLDNQRAKGTAILASNAIPLFDVRMKGAEANIVEYAINQKGDTMTDNLPPTEEGQQPSPTESEDRPLPVDQIPLTITVEMGRFHMPLEKVAQLKPGNVLDLANNANAQVELTIGSKRVATGELVKLGESMGVKIVTLGD